MTALPSCRRRSKRRAEGAREAPATSSVPLPVRRGGRPMDGFAIVFLSKRGEGVMALSVQEAAPALQRGASGVEVQILQHRLNRIGALLDCDGDFGDRKSTRLNSSH